MAKILMYYPDWASNVSRQTQDLPGGVGYYRICKIAEQIKDHEVTVVGAKLTKKGESASDRWQRIFTDYDVFWSCYSSHGDDLAAMFYWRDTLGKKVILDCDDNYLDVAESHPLHDKLKETKRDRAFISTGLSFADVITVSTEPLKNRLYNHMKGVYGLEKEIVVIPNFNDIKEWDFKKKKNKNKIIIGYPGSNSHQDDLKMVMPHIHEAMKKHPNVYLEIVGSVDSKMLPILFKDFDKEVMNRCDLWPGTATFKEYPEFIASRNWDIGIAPLVDSAFTRCKSHIKFMEFSALKVPVIASRVYPYYMELLGRDTIENEVTGLLCTPKEWPNAIERMITDEKLRKELAENAHKHIKDKWQYSESGINEIVNNFINKE